MVQSPAAARPSRRIVLLTKIKTSSMRLGATTLSFFRKGEELEAAEFENLPHDDPTLVPPKLGFRSFEKVPRRRTPLLLTILALVGVTAGLLGWRSVRHAPREAGRIATSIRGKASGDWMRLKASAGADVPRQGP